MSSTLKASSLQNLSQEFYGSKKAIPAPILHQQNQDLQPQVYGSSCYSSNTGAAADAPHENINDAAAVVPSSTMMNEVTFLQQTPTQRHRLQKRAVSVCSSVSSSSSSSSTSAASTRSSACTPPQLVNPPNIAINGSSSTSVVALLLQQQQQQQQQKQVLQQQQQPVQSSSSSFSKAPTVVAKSSSVSSSTVVPIVMSSTQEDNTNNTISSSTINAAYTPLTSDWRTLSITSNISKFESTLVSRLNVWKKDHGISSTVLHVTAPNACGLVRLLPVIPTTPFSSNQSSFAYNLQQQQQQQQPSSPSSRTNNHPSKNDWASALPASFGNIESYSSLHNNKNKQQAQQDAQSRFVPLAPIDLPACANLSRSIVAVIMSTLNTCSRLEISVLRVICHDFSEFSHPSTLHNGNNTSMLLSMFENVGSSSSPSTATAAVPPALTIASSTQNQKQQQRKETTNQKQQKAVAPTFAEKVLLGPASGVRPLSASAAAFASTLPGTSNNNTTNNNNLLSVVVGSGNKQPSTFKSLQLDSVPVVVTTAVGCKNENTNNITSTFQGITNKDDSLHRRNSVNFGSIGNLNKLQSNENNNNNLVAAIISTPAPTSVASSILLGTNQHQQQHNIFFSKTDAFFSVPVVSPFLQYSQHKPQHYVQEHQKAGMISPSTAGKNQQQQQQNQNVAIYKVMDLVHDNRALQSLLYPEQWIYSLSYFIAEVLMLFDGRDTPCRIRHAEKAISVFPSFAFAAFANQHKNETSKVYNPHAAAALTITSFSELRQCLYEVADLEGFTHSVDKKALQSRIPPRRGGNFDDDGDQDDHHRKNFDAQGAALLVTEDTVARFIYFVYERLRLVQKGKYLKLANFLRSICDMPLGVIPVRGNNNSNKASAAATSDAGGARLPPITTPSLRGGAASLFYGFHRRGPTCAETGQHHQHFVNRAAHRTMLSGTRFASAFSEETEKANSSKTSNNNNIVAPPQYSSYSAVASQQQQQQNNAAPTPAQLANNNYNNGNANAASPLLKLSREQGQELFRWTSLGVTNCVIHVFGNEQKKIIYLTPVVSSLNEPSSSAVTDAAIVQQQQAASAAPPCSISWTIQQQQQQQASSAHHSPKNNNNNKMGNQSINNDANNTNTSAFASHRSSTADYLTAAMTIADFDARAPVLRVIFHNLWAFRDSKLTISDFTPEDPFFVAYVMSAVKNTDRLIDLLFVENSSNAQQQTSPPGINNNNDSSLGSNESSSAGANSTSNNSNGKISNNHVVIAENHWIGGMIKFLRSCLTFLKNFSAEKEALQNNLDEALRLLHNFRTPLLSLEELKDGLMSFVSFMKNSPSSESSTLSVVFDNSESILDWLNSLLTAVTFLEEVNNNKMKENNNNNSNNKEGLPALIKLIRFLITVCVLPMRPTQHNVLEADENGQKLSDVVVVDGDNNNNNNTRLSSVDNNTYHYSRSSHNNNNNRDNNSKNNVRRGGNDQHKRSRRGGKGRRSS